MTAKLVWLKSLDLHLQSNLRRSTVRKEFKTQKLTLVFLLLRALGDEDEEREHLLEVDALPPASAAHAAVHHGTHATAVPGAHQAEYALCWEKMMKVCQSNFNINLTQAVLKVA